MNTPWLRATAPSGYPRHMSQAEEELRRIAGPRRFRREMYHHEGVTDLAVLRRDAARAAQREPVLLHLHPYDELRRCDAGDADHETFERIEDHDV
jgi:hypothetical protein